MGDNLIPNGLSRGFGVQFQVEKSETKVIKLTEPNAAVGESNASFCSLLRQLNDCSQIG
jgi:hypothetical protein